MRLKRPYLLFLGDAPDQLAAKVAFGIRDWRPENAVGQLRLDGCKADLEIADKTVAEARGDGANTLVIGVANRGGVINDSWLPTLLEAIDAGMDIAAGLHTRLTDQPVLAKAAAEKGVTLHDVRHPTETFQVASGARRPGKRLLPIGTDCSCGKMYTALAIEKEMRARGWSADFRATGQTGILITGAGVSIDAVVADFISGAVESLAPAAAQDHWDLVEGQGSLMHPSFSGVTLGLIHGAQADALVLCHEPTRTHMRGLPHFPIPTLDAVMDLGLAHARLVNPSAYFAGVSVNTANLGAGDAARSLEQIEQRTGLPTVDPVRTGVGRIVDALLHTDGS